MLPLFLGKNVLRGIDFAPFRRRRRDNAISLADHFHGLAFVQITADRAIGQVGLAVHEACNRARDVSGLRSTCTAFCSVQAAVSETDESEQIKIRAVSILFPLAFLGGVVQRAARTQHPPCASKNYANLPV